MEEEGPFDKYQNELRVSLEELHNSVVSKVRQAKEEFQRQTTLDQNDQQVKKVRTDLDKQLERVHLAASNYFGQCTERRTEIEKVISEQLDVIGFGEVGRALMQ